MARARRSRGTRFDSGNHAGNSLRSYRMSMLAHGFVDEPDGAEFKSDESDPMSYGVVRLRGSQLSVVVVITLAVVAALAVAAYVLLV